MKRLNRKVEYALMALKVMAGKRAGELTTAKEVVEENGWSVRRRRARVLQQLAQRSILRSSRRHGGYLLIRDLSRLSLHELNECILGAQSLTKCLDHEAGCGPQGQVQHLVAGRDFEPAFDRILPDAERGRTAARAQDRTVGERAMKELDREYKHGFVTEIESETIRRGLSEDIVRLISEKKNEPEWLLEFRLKAYRHWLTLSEPHHWARSRTIPSSTISSITTRRRSRPA